MFDTQRQLGELSNQIARFTAITKKYLDGEELKLDDAVALAKFGYITSDCEIHINAIHRLKNSSERSVLKQLSREIDQYYALIENYEWDPDDFDLLLVLDRHMCTEYEALCNDAMFKCDEDNKTQLDWFRGAIDAIENNTDGPIVAVWEAKSQLELDYEARLAELFDTMEETIARYKSFLRYRTLREYCEHFTYYGMHDVLSRLEMAIEDVSDSVKIHNPLDVMFGECDDENILLSLVKSAKESNDSINQGWIHQFEQPAEEPESERCDTRLTFFNMLQIDMIHKLCNQEQFENISPGDMYSILNLHDCPRRLKIRDGEKNRVYYFIFFFGEMIDSAHRSHWRKSMCHHFCMSYKTYNSKYTELKTHPSKNDERFLERLRELKEDFEEIREAS